VGEDRFRPNILIDGDFPGFAEDSWSHVKIGEAVFRNVKLCTRCVFITVTKKAIKNSIMILTLTRVIMNGIMILTLTKIIMNSIMILTLTRVIMNSILLNIIRLTLKPA